MKIYRGQNSKVDSFEITEGSSSIMSEYGPGLYFFDFTHRNRALVYSLDNSNLLNDDADDDEPEQLDKGYFYQCSVKQDESRTLDKLAPSEIPDIQNFVDNLLDSIECNTSFTDAFAGNDPDERYLSAISYFMDCDSIYEMINEIYDSLEPSCNRDFCKAIAKELKCINSFVAVANESLGEVVVYDPASVSIDMTIEVTPDDLKRTFEERMALVRDVQC